MASTDDSPVPLNSYDFELTDDEIAAGLHRTKVGGQWAKIGRLQLDFLVSQGLRPQDRLLDVGCGSLRGGIHMARYLLPGNYYGIDSNASLLRAALVKEIPEAGLTERVPADHLKETARFDSDFGVAFDVAIAQSIFTHLPLNHLQLCMARLARSMRPGGRFFVTYFEPAPGQPFDATSQQPAVTSYAERDPFHYSREHLAWAAASVGPWRFRPIGDWGHPRGQQMAEFVLGSGSAAPVAGAALDRARHLARTARGALASRRA